MTSSEIRQRFIDFFVRRGHAVVPSASLVPKGDPSVLFTTAGMQPFVPYLLGEPHPLGKRLVNCQKCVRTIDIDEVGDIRHLTFFEMLGNWSLGDYFKEDAIAWSYEFLTSKDEGLGLDPNRLYVSVFEGDENATRDNEAVEIWKKFIPESRIYFLPASNNWWSPGENGPCGPDTEMFYDITEKGIGNMSHDQFILADEEGKVVEIWNDVFMQYQKKDGKVVGKLAKKNVDTGSGLDRVTMVVQGKSNVYETDTFAPLMNEIKKETLHYDLRSARILADHIRTSMFLVADGVIPSNKDQGYVLRRLIRRAVMQTKKLGLNEYFISGAITVLSSLHSTTYPELINFKISEVIENEISKFVNTLELGLKEFEKGADPFVLASTYGFPIELTEELAKEKNIVIDRQKFDREMKLHQENSRAGAGQKFKGGLANTSEKVTALHTAHHLLLAALKNILGSSIHQKGSNITEDRLRIDFNFDRKMTDEEKNKVEQWVNDAISNEYNVVRREMIRKQAEEIGAEMEFGAKYPDIVSVYFIEDENGNVISKEFCGGPHVSNTSNIGKFKILKEEAVAAGIRRIKATLL